MKFIYFVLAVFFSVTVQAQYTTVNSARLYIFNPETRYERDSNQEFSDRRPLNLALGYKRKTVSLVLEYARFKETTGNATSEIERLHQDYLFWFKSHFMDYQDQEYKGNLFFGVGAGGYQEEVTTTFMSTARNDKSGLKFVSGLVGGGEFIRMINNSFSMLLSLEGRALFSSEYDPNPIWSAVGRVGIQLHW
ncbi:MAG: hypothetical protein ACXVCP_18570 [Bdellovibrio sp.]